MSTGLEQEYHTTCRGCKTDVALNLETWQASHAGDDGEYTSRLSVDRKRTRHGDRWGGLTSVTWVCPVCFHSHKDTTWVPDNQAMLPGFDWR